MINFLISFLFLFITPLSLIDPLNLVESSNISETIKSHEDEIKMIFKSVNTVTILLTNDTPFLEHITDLFFKSYTIYKLDLPESDSFDFHCHDFNKIKHEENIIFVEKDGGLRRKKRAITADKILIDMLEFRESWDEVTNTGYIIQTNSHFLRMLMDCLVNPVGTFLFILEDEMSLEDYEKYIAQNFRNAWRNIGSYDIHLFINNKIITFDPFMMNNVTQNHGSIVLSSERKKDLFRNLNKYPLRIEVIWSTYSVPKYSKTTKKFKYYYGADVEAIKGLKKVMNFSGK